MLFQRALSCPAIASWLCFAVAGVALGCASPDNPGGSSVTPSTSVSGPSASGPSAGAASSSAPSGGSNGGPSAGAASSTRPPGGNTDGPSAGTGSCSVPSGGNAGGPSIGTGSSSSASGDNTGGPSTSTASNSGPSGGNAGSSSTSTASSSVASGGSAGNASNGAGGNASNGAGGNEPGGNGPGGVSNASGGSAAGVGGGPNGDNSAGGGSAGSPDAPEPFTFGEPPAAANYFKKGINLGNRMEAPNEGDWGGSVLASDFPHIAARGFDHVRIPIRFSGHALSGAPYTIDTPFFERVDAVLDQATTAGLAVIIDLHAYDEMATDPSGQRERFLALWSQIAARYKDRPDSVAFELLNEPNTQLDTLWNEIAAAAISTVRTTNPRRLLVVDTVFWADPSKLSLLTLPDDANLLVTIHLYEPKLFSFQGKSWMGEPYMTTGVIFPGPPATPIAPVQAALDESWAASWFDAYNTLPAADNPSGPATIDAQVAYITAYKNTTGRTVHNGEWGPQDGGDMTSRANLVQMVREKCEAEDIGWAIWEDPNNMKLFDSAAGTWVTPIIDALLP